MGIFFGKFVGLFIEVLTALLRRRTVGPGDAKFLARLLRLPPGIGNDGDAAVKAEKILRAFDEKGVANTRKRADFVHIGGSGFAREYGTLLENGEQHAGN